MSATYTRLPVPDRIPIDPADVRGYTDPFGDGEQRRYECGQWTSPVLQPPFGATGVVVSWAARTPGTSWLEVEVRGGEPRSAWFALARWAETDAEIHPTSVPGQAADGVRVETDEVRVDAGRAWESVQVRVTLLRGVGTDDEPALESIGVLTSRVDQAAGRRTSRFSLAREHVLDVPAYSQQVHRDTYPQYDNGGQSWCSPTAVSMVLAYWGKPPVEDSYTWVDPSGPDRMVPCAARSCFDHAYGGAGNWAFNTAFAARQGVQAFVTRLRDLTEVEAFVAAGIPLVLSVAHHTGDLDGAGYETNGHLLVASGFTPAGDVVVDDPASHGIPSNAQVRTTYRRDQLERTWLRASGGIAYVIHPPDVRLPPATAEANW